MLRFVDRLTVELEDKLGMAGLQNVGVNILVTRDAGVGANIEISQITHASADSSRISPIGASMSAQPRFGRAMTIVAGNAFVRTRSRRESVGGHRLKRRMTNGAPGARLRLRDAERFTDPRRTRIEQNGVGAGM